MTQPRHTHSLTFWHVRDRPLADALGDDLFAIDGGGGDSGGGGGEARV